MSYYFQRGHVAMRLARSVRDVATPSPRGRDHPPTTSLRESG